MPRNVPIFEPADERLADYRELTDVALRTRYEPPNGLFIAEGELVLRRALRAGYRPRSVLLDTKRLDQLADLDGELDGAPVYTAGLDLLAEVTGFNVHRGVLASFHRRPLPAAADVLAAARRVLLLEDVNNHTNIGAMFRCAAGLGMDAVLLSETCADPLYRRSVRVSMGHVLRTPFAVLPEPWPESMSAALQGFTVLALTPDPTATALREVAVPPRWAVLLGAEGPGLSAAAMAAADLRVRIPMTPGVDSLNVATAAAVAFSHLT